MVSMNNHDNISEVISIWELGFETGWEDAVRGTGVDADDLQEFDDKEKTDFLEGYREGYSMAKMDSF